jgi:hypothetical protein
MDGLRGSQNLSVGERTCDTCRATSDAEIWDELFVDLPIRERNDSGRVVNIVQTLVRILPEGLVNRCVAEQIECKYGS